MIGALDHLDLRDGTCVGDWDFLDRHRAIQYATCLQCPVLAVCSAATTKPGDGSVCVHGHVRSAETVTSSGECRVCKTDRNNGTRTPPNVTQEALDARTPPPRQYSKNAYDWAEVLRFIITMRAAGQGWPAILTDLCLSASALQRKLYRHGEKALALDLAPLVAEARKAARAA